MPALNPLLALDVSTRARADAFAPEWDLSTRSVRSTSDSLALTIAITRELAAALESSVRLVGVQIEIDKGDGVLVPLMQTEIDGAVSLKASRDGYGSRTLSVTLQVPPSQSPFYTAWARGPHRVRMTGYLGLPGAMQPRPMFVGHVAQCSWEAYPSLLRVECQDLSALLSSEMLAYNLEPGSLRTRKSVFREIFDPYLALYDIEFGSLDFGADDGGVLFKGISEGGTVSLLQWAAAFLAPIARRMNFGDGSCNVEPSYTSGPVVRTYRANDIANLTVSLPSTSDPNAVVMSSTVFAYIGPSGHRTEVEIKITRAVFAPATASRRQDHVTGSIEELSLTLDAVEQETSRTITTRGYDGGTIISTSVQEWGWYSARACPNEQLDDGSVTFNHAFDVYQYADGIWRADSQQQYQVLRTSSSFRNFEGGALSSESQLVNKFAPSIVPLAYVDTAGSLAYFPVFLAGDGTGWFAGREYYYHSGDDSPQGVDEIVFGLGAGTLATNGRRLQSNQGAGRIWRNVFYNSDADGTLASTRSETSTWGYGYTLWSSIPLGDDGFVFGPGTRYAKLATADGSVPAPGVIPVGTKRVTVFSPIDETSHRETETAYLFPYFDVDDLPSVTASDAVVAGAIPKVETPTSRQTAQPASVTVIDSVRESLLGKEVDDHQQNDFCETIDELRVCALELLREKAPAVDFDALIDWTSEPGKAISILLPDAIPAGVVFTAWDMEWIINGMTGENKQHVTARWLPQELL
jgi:hypothetical protein